MRRALPLAIALVLLPASTAGATTYPVCPLITAPVPPMEGTSGYVFVGQPQPCPPRGRTQADFQVTTDFGDGTLAETPFKDGDFLWAVGADHTYRRAGTYQLVATATDRQTGEQIVMSHPIDIRNAPLTKLRIQRPTFSARRTVSRTVARFADGNALATPEDHIATIHWGDGTRSAGTIVKSGRLGYRVIGAHRYRTAKRHRITVVVHDDRGATLRIRA
jgi:hypothetical protein